MQPYYADEWTALYCGDMREVLPALDLTADVVITDPPFGETELTWDRWPDGWPAVVAGVTDQMWCFGSVRMFLERHAEFAGWKFAQDVIWEKQAGTSMHADKFRRVHEHVLHWYRGPWGALHRDGPREDVATGTPHVSFRRSQARPQHANGGHRPSYTRREDSDGRRLVKSIIAARNLHMRSLHPMEKPLGILLPLVRYSCPVGGRVVDPFAGSGSTLAAARLSGRGAVGIEGDERYCEVIATRLGQGLLFDGEEGEDAEPPPAPFPAPPQTSPLF